MAERDLITKVAKVVFWYSHSYYSILFCIKDKKFFLKELVESGKAGVHKEPIG